MFKPSKRFRLPIIGILFATLFLLPLEALTAPLLEYVLLLDFLKILIGDAPQANLPPAARIVIDQLNTAVEGARAANIVGNSTAELTRLSKAIGAAQALMGMSAACGDCGEVRDLLQQIIGQAALLKTRFIGASGTCNPNGIVQPNEQCDPLAIPTGCPVNATAVTYCSDECLCEIAVTP